MTLADKVLASLGEPMQEKVAPAPIAPQPIVAVKAPETVTLEKAPDAVVEEEDDEKMGLSESIAFCLQLGTDPETQLMCAAYMVASPDDTKCPDHMGLLTQPDCPYCDRAKHRYDDLIKKGLIEEIDIHSERGKKMADKVGINYTPGLIVFGCNDDVRASLGNALHPALAWTHDGVGVNDKAIEAAAEANSADEALDKEEATSGKDNSAV